MQGGMANIAHKIELFRHRSSVFRFFSERKVHKYRMPGVCPG